MKISRIVSGGQTGADRGGLDAGLALGIPIGGWCPKGRIAEDGRIPDIYQLNESTSKNYLRRTELNVVDSEATVIFTYGVPSGGSSRTIDFAIKHSRSFLCCDLNDLEKCGVTFNTFLGELGEGVVLNVAGSRESKAPGIQIAVRDFLITVFKEV